MADETNPGANDTDGGDADPQPVTQADLDAAKAETTAAKASQASVQRTLQTTRDALQAAQTQGTQALATAEAMEGLVDMVERLGKAAEVDGMDATAIKTKLREVREAATKPADKAPAEMEKAGVQILNAAELSGINQGDFENVWQTDTRLVEARAYWRSGQYDMAVSSAQVAFANTPKGKTYSEADVQKLVKDEVAKSGRVAAGEGNESSTLSHKRAITDEDFQAATPEERVKMLPAIKEQIRASQRKT